MHFWYKLDNTIVWKITLSVHYIKGTKWKLSLFNHKKYIFFIIGTHCYLSSIESRWFPFFRHKRISSWVPLQVPYSHMRDNKWWQNYFWVNSVPSHTSQTRSLKILQQMYVSEHCPVSSNRWSSKNSPAISVVFIHSSLIYRTVLLLASILKNRQTGTELRLMKVAAVSARFSTYSWKVNKRWTSHLLAHLWTTDPNPPGHQLSFSAIWPRATTAHKYWWREQCFCLSRVARQISFSGDVIGRIAVRRRRACADKDARAH